MTKEPPTNYRHKYSWQKDHKPNKTGTPEAYLPTSHPLSKSINSNIPKSEYESWKPE